MENECGNFRNVELLCFKNGMHTPNIFEHLRRELSIGNCQVKGRPHAQPNETVQISTLNLKFAGELCYPSIIFRPVFFFKFSDHESSDFTQIPQNLHL